MKTFSKVLSLLIVAVMCVGLIGNAFADDFIFGDEGGAAADYSGDSGFSFGESGGAPDEGGFSFDGETSTGFIMDEPAQVETPAEPGFSMGEDEKEAPKEEQKEFSFAGDDFSAENKPYKESDGYTFTISPKVFKKSDTADVVITSSPKLEPDTFFKIEYTDSSFYTLSTRHVNIEEKTVQEDGKIVLKASWLKTLDVGTYYLWGIPADGSAAVYLGYVQVNEADAADYGTFTVYNTPYSQYSAAGNEVYLKPVDSARNFNQFARFAYASVLTNKGDYLKAGVDYDVSSQLLSLSRSFLNSLSSGEYWIIGLPDINGSVTVKLGKMTIKSASDSGSTGWTLSPDYYYAWCSGDDPLVFNSDLMALRKFSKDHWVMPRYAYGANSIPNKYIDANQFWDYENGVFALGVNFLSTLPAGVYTLQVIDLKTYECTNTVQFRIGATLKPMDTDKHVIGSIKNLRFRCDDPVSQVYVGTIPLTYGEDYVLSSDRRVITLSYEFLNNRSAGYTYSIKAVTDSGDYASSSFQILTTGQASSSPRTGDTSNIGLWSAFLLLSGTAIVVLVPKLRGREN